MKHTLFCIAAFAIAPAAVAQGNNSASVGCQLANICSTANSNEIIIEPGRFILPTVSKHLSARDPRVSESEDSDFHICFEGENQLTSNDASFENIRLTGEFKCLKVPIEIYNEAIDAIQVWESL